MGSPQHMLVQDVSTRWNSTYHMLSKLLEQRWPVTAALSDPTVSQRGKHHYLDLKPDQWNLIEELSHALEPFEGATVFLSGQQYVTLSALPQLVQSLKKSIQRSAETAPVKEIQANLAEQITSRWQGLFVFEPASPNTILVAAALDPRFRKLKFLPADEIFKVQSTVQTMALSVRKETKQRSVNEDNPSTTYWDHLTPAPVMKRMRRNRTTKMCRRRS